MILEAHGVGIGGVHFRIAAVIGVAPFVHAGEERDPLVVGEFQFVGDARMPPCMSAAESNSTMLRATVPTVPMDHVGDHAAGLVDVRDRADERRRERRKAWEQDAQQHRHGVGFVVAMREDGEDHGLQFVGGDAVGIGRGGGQEPALPGMAKIIGGFPSGELNMHRNRPRRARWRG